MKYISARSLSSAASPGVTFSQAVLSAMALDGGLFLPAQFPSLDINLFRDLPPPAEFGARLLQAFLSEDPLQSQLPDICRESLNFALPLQFLPQETAVLELFHGPTAAFKDVGARFLASCLQRLPAPLSTVIVATSGDTGGAVASAFFGQPGVEVLILFPKGKISARQEMQLTCWGGNIRAFAVRGVFDDCQKLAKQALATPQWQERSRLLSANSINLGRLLPQMIYHARASMEYVQKRGRRAGLIIPSGNLGNAVAALWAKQLGFPIRQVILATNANRSISDFFQTEKWNPSPTVTTLANAMDVGNPSNMERLLYLYPEMSKLKKDISASLATDTEISEAIRQGPKTWGQIWCPHTATAVVARQRRSDNDWIIAATAHPAKFETIVEPLIGAPVAVPATLQALINRPASVEEIEPNLEALWKAVTQSL